MVLLYLPALAPVELSAFAVLFHGVQPLGFLPLLVGEKRLDLVAGLRSVDHQLGFGLGLGGGQGADGGLIDLLCPRGFAKLPAGLGHLLAQRLTLLPRFGDNGGDLRPLLLGEVEYLGHAGHLLLMPFSLLLRPCRALSRTVPGRGGDGGGHGGSEHGDDHQGNDETIFHGVPPW